MIATETLLDNPIWHALTHQHAALALGDDLARRYPADSAVFAGAAEDTAEAFERLAALIPAGDVVGLLGSAPPAGDTWTTLRQLDLLQMVYEGTAVDADENALITPLTPDAVPAMLALVDQTHPGPFLPRTITLGDYFGIWQDGQLAAMAGERLHLPGYHEISAVCTHPDFQRRGYARQLLVHLIGKMQREGDVPILHVFGENAGAITLYESLGFRVRTEIPLYVLKRN